MTRAKIIGKITLDESHLRKLAAANINDIATDNPANRNDENEIVKRIGNAEAIIINISINITKNILDQCPNLRFIQTWSTGMDNIDLISAKDKGIVVKNVPDFSVESVSEKTIGLMIFIANNLLQANLDAKAGNWDYAKFQGVELKEKNLCIIGKGKIGSRVGELAKAFGMNIFFVDSKTSKEQFLNFLSKSDFVTLHCPYNTSSHHLLGADEFNAMKKGVFFINNSRGGVVDENALLNALNSGVVKFASIDVFEKEPPQKNNRLLQHPKVFVTPHCTWNTKEAVKRLSDACVDNICHYLRR